MKIITSLLFFILLTGTAFASSLTDVASHRNAKAINYLYNSKVISGYSDGTFKPNKSLNRAELLKILVGGKGVQPELTEYSNCFPDVKEEWFAPFVCYAKEQEWVGGYPDGTFQPAKTVSKIEAIKMLVNSQGYAVTEKVNGELYSDVDNNQWYAPFLKVAKEKGLLEEVGGSFGVNKEMQRGTISENIYRAIIIEKYQLKTFVENFEEASKVSGTEKELYDVVKVIDGDTVVVDINGTDTTLRLIGIDTPETVHPSKPVECFGKEASAETKRLLEDAKVSLEADKTQGEFDKYGRLLRYIILEDGTNFNKHLIERGYAHEYTYNIPYKYQKEFKDAQKGAESGGIGLWADGACSDASEDKNDTVEDSGVAVDTSSYECSFNAYNCSDFDTQKEAQSAFDYCYKEVGKDIHKLDRDDDLQACESLD